MIILRDQSQVASIANALMKRLAALRLNQLHSPGDPDTPDALGCLIVVDVGDSIESLEDAAGYAILTSLDGLAFGHPDFYPCTEILEKHHHENACVYEVVFIGSDDGTFASLLVPDDEGIDTDLLAMCRSFATPAVTSP